MDEYEAAVADANRFKAAFADLATGKAGMSKREKAAWKHASDAVAAALDAPQAFRTRGDVSDLVRKAVEGTPGLSLGQQK